MIRSSRPAFIAALLTGGFAAFGLAVQERSGPSSPRAFSEAYKACVERKDAPAVYSGLSRQSKELLLKIADLAISRAAKDPEAAKSFASEFGLKKSPAEMKPQEVAVEMVRKEIGKTVSIEIVKVTESGDHAELVVDMKSEGSSTTKREILRLIKEGGAWAEDHYSMTVDTIKRGHAASLMSHVTQALKAYDLDKNGYPSTGNANMVKALQEKGFRGQPYLDLAIDIKGICKADGDVIDVKAIGDLSGVNERNELLDPWGRPYVYINNVNKSAPPGWVPKNQRSFDIFSFGPNGIDEKGDGDDVANWK